VSPRVRLEPMTAAHLDDVMVLENTSFEDPWPREAFVEELGLSQSNIVLLRDDQDLLVGYILYWVVLDEAELLNIAVHTDHRGQGHGRTLLETGLQAARQRGGQMMHLEVRRSNAPAIALYDSAGFQRTGIRRRYYANNGEDAILMRVDLR
jgi:ribosomal-protein-alanine N-acetyltransferase